MRRDIGDPLQVEKKLLDSHYHLEELVKKRTAEVEEEMEKQYQIFT